MTRFEVKVNIEDGAGRRIGGDADWVHDQIARALSRRFSNFTIEVKEVAA